jgi:chorismate mutase
MAEQADEVQGRIAELRKLIDEKDCELVRLLNERASLALSIRELKPQVRWALYDPKREEEIFENLSACNAGPLYDDNLREIFDTILRVMKEM